MDVVGVVVGIGDGLLVSLGSIRETSFESLSNSETSSSFLPSSLLPPNDVGVDPLLLSLLLQAIGQFAII